MKCPEIGSYFEEHSLLENDGTVHAEVIEHISDCAECRRFVEMRSEAGIRLRLLRDSGPAVPATLDRAVLAKYRSFIAAQAQAARSPWRVGISDWRLAIAAAVALLLFAATFLPGRRSLTVSTQPKAVQTQSVKAPAPGTSNAVRAGLTDRPARVSGHKRTAKAIAPEPVPSQISSTADAQHPLPGEFRSLMYCDELSCGGGMDVVRVQLPSLPEGFMPSAGFMPVAGSSNRVVTADVLVGADGFARGIRFVH